MNVVCALSSAEVPEENSVSILVLPEDISNAEVLTASRRHPDTLVVAAVRDGQHMRGYIMVNGKNQIDYLKTLGDGRSDPYFGSQELPIYESAAVAVGVLVCRDYQSNELRLPMLERLQKATASVSVICVPADMSGDFFSHDQIAVFPGVFCALSNNKKTYENPHRCRSFISNKSGAVVSRQLGYEAISASAA